jgi:hypothetical protein
MPRFFSMLDETPIPWTVEVLAGDRRRQPSSSQVLFQGDSAAVQTTSESPGWRTPPSESHLEVRRLAGRPVGPSPGA